MPFNLTNELTNLTERGILTSFERLGLKDKLKSSRWQSVFKKNPKKKKKKKEKEKHATAISM